MLNEVMSGTSSLRSEQLLGGLGLRVIQSKSEAGEENRRGARGVGRRRRRRGPNPFKADIIPRSSQLFLTSIFCHKSIPGFRSLWISLPQELGQIRDALRRRLLPPLLQLQEGVRAVHRQGDGDPGEDSLSLNVVLSNLQGRDPGSRSSLPSCALWQDDLGCNCH